MSSRFPANKFAAAEGVMGDETEEQNLNQPGDPSKRITEEEVDEAFGDKAGKPGQT